MQKHLIALFFVLTGSAFGNDSSAPAASEDIRILERSEHYLRGLIGFAGHVSAGELAFERLLQAPDAEAIFLQIVKSTPATGAAKVYAACVLSQLGGGRLPEVVQLLQREDRYVSTMNGDVLTKRRMSEFIEQISRVVC
ncbi:hypothetical protein AB4Z46_18035 [Variovorax sp. M-6]|uniref:hypothetical protein n=1 Tax=Variovorax sp. M-6 TaxID=3233041 RepID=UPI003F976086